MDKRELHLLQAYLRRTFDSQALKVVSHPSEAERADVMLGERRIATIAVDDEDGDRSFSLAMKVPVDRAAIESYLRLLFDNPKLKVVPRARKTDSVELASGSDFLGVLSADDAQRSSFTLQMAILDYDLEDV